MKAGLTPDASLTEALQRVVDLYEAWEKPDEAAKWRAELEKLKKPGQEKGSEG